MDCADVVVGSVLDGRGRVKDFWSTSKANYLPCPLHNPHFRLLLVRIPTSEEWIPSPRLLLSTRTELLPWPSGESSGVRTNGITRSGRDQ